MQFEGRVAYVTGGASGIGEGISRHLASLGALVVVGDRDEVRGKELASSVSGIEFLPIDVTDMQSVTASTSEASATFGPIDILVNVAGGDIVSPFVDTSEELWYSLIELNLLGVLRCTRAVLPGMIERGYGRVVSIASDAARVGSSGEAVYAGCKGGVISFTKTVAREVARKGVTLNCVCPGPTDTPPVQRMVAEGSEKLIDALKKAVPIGRLGTPADIAPAVAYFASDGASFVTGQTLSVSGGMTMA